MAQSEPATKQDLQQVVDKLTELIRDVETSLLTFHGYGILNLETRRGPGQH